MTMPTKVKGVTIIPLLAGGERYECETCHKTFETMSGCRGHLASHGERRPRRTKAQIAADRAAANPTGQIAAKISEVISQNINDAIEEAVTMRTSFILRKMQAMEAERDEARRALRRYKKVFRNLSDLAS